MESFPIPYRVGIMNRSYHLSISDKNGSEGTKLSVEVLLYSILYPMDFKMHRDGKGANPREHR